MSLKKNFEKLKDILTGAPIVSYELLSEVLTEVSEVLENEDSFYRPKASDKTAGGLIDFHEDKLPVAVVPDFHARPLFLLNILEYQFNQDNDSLFGLTVFEALAQGRLRLVCVGDLLHTERCSRERWTAAGAEFDNGIFTGPAMSAEMQEGLSLLCALYYLKTLFPQYVHILKGNHENIMNVTGGGDYAFRKYSDEGEMCRTFIQEYYGDDVLYLIDCVEKNLPLFYFGKKCMVSHAEPARPFSRQELVDARLYPAVVQGLTWTDNGEAFEGSVNETIKKLVGLISDAQDYVWLGGHRPVSDNYSLRQNGQYIQIHNPARQNIALVRGEGKFNPDTDIIEVKK